MAGLDAPPCTVALYVIGMLISGTLNTLTTKIQFTMRSTGLDGKEETFEKPWFGTLNMLLAMALVGVVYAAVQLVSGASKKTAVMAPLIEEGLSKPDGPSQTTKYCLVAFPAAFDLAATALCCAGILYIPASVWQMLRGSSIVFCALFSITFLKRIMYKWNWIGLALCVLGVTGVGLASVLGSAQQSNSSDPAEMAFGMALVIAGQVVQAAQVIAEEWLMKDVDLPAMQVVGLEGMWGTLIMFVVIYPALYCLPGSDRGHLEDPFDTFTMLSNSTPLMAMVCVYLFSCGTFNATGIAVSGALSSVHRMMFDASRTMVIWAFGLAVHYFYDPHSAFGEVLTSYSGLQLGSFLVLVIGQAVYGEVLKLPGVKYPKPQRVLAPSPAQALNLASPLPRALDE